MAQMTRSRVALPAFGMERLLLIYRYRDLLRNLVSRDVRLRYKNSILGFFWSLLNPLLIMTVFTLVFQVFLGNPRKDFYVFLLCALLPWNWCITSVTGSVNAVVANANLVLKVFFPRELLPISIVLSNLVNFLLALIVYAVFAMIAHLALGPSLILLPVLILNEFLFIAGLALMLSALNVFFRDVGVILEAVTLAWFFLTPIFYDVGEVQPQHVSLFYWLNPMASLVESYRMILYRGGWPDPLFLLRTFVTGLVVFIIGYVIFLKLSPRFGEEL